MRLEFDEKERHEVKEALQTSSPHFLGVFDEAGEQQPKENGAPRVHFRLSVFRSVMLYLE